MLDSNYKEQISMTIVYQNKNGIIKGHVRYKIIKNE